MGNSNLVKSFCGMLSLGLLCLMAACSSSPEKQLNGEWDCKFGGESHAMKLEVGDGFITAIDPSEPKDSKKLTIKKVDGDKITVANPEDPNETMAFKFSNKNTFTMVHEKHGEGPVCTRK